MLIDGQGRVVNYLRVSLTERCNFRCQYCMPEKPFSWMPNENLLSFDELFLFIKAAMDEGINKVRLTGGEPLLRENLDKFIEKINNHIESAKMIENIKKENIKKTAIKLGIEVEEFKEIKKPMLVFGSFSVVEEFLRSKFAGKSI